MNINFIPFIKEFKEYITEVNENTLPSPFNHEQIVFLFSNNIRISLIYGSCTFNQFEIQVTKEGIPIHSEVTDESGICRRNTEQMIEVMKLFQEK